MMFKGTTFAYDTFRCRLSDLIEKGLVKVLDNGNGYSLISEKGEAFLDGDFDAGELPDPSEE